MNSCSVHLFVSLFVFRGEGSKCLGVATPNLYAQKMPLGAGGEKVRQVLRPWKGLQSILQQVLQSAVIAYVDAL